MAEKSLRDKVEEGDMVAAIKDGAAIAAIRDELRRSALEAQENLDRSDFSLEGGEFRKNYSFYLTGIKATVKRLDYAIDRIIENGKEARKELGLKKSMK